MKLDKREVDIRLVSRQSEERGSEPEMTEIMSLGTLEATENGFAVEYEESEATGFEGCVTRLESFGDSKVVMARTGSVTSNMVIEMGEKHHCIYGTQYGNFEVGVEAQKIAVKLDENGGKLAFSYVVDVNSSLVGVFEIEVEVRPR